MTEGRPRVIFVEDDDDLRDAVVSYLQFCGFDAAGFACPRAARESAELTRAHAVITDLTLRHGENGLELARALRTAKGPKLVCLSGDAATIDEDNGVFDVMLMKPVDLDVLAQTLRTLLAS